MTPDLRYALVSRFDSESLVVWNLMSHQIEKVMDIPGLDWRPYVSSDSNSIIVSSNQGETTVIDSWTLALSKKIKTNKKPEKIRTGWLESVGITETESAIYTYDLVGSEPTKSLTTSGRTLAMTVVSDSKTLFTTTANSQDISAINIRTGKEVETIQTKLKQPYLLEMGLTNTACH